MRILIVNDSDVCRVRDAFDRDKTAELTFFREGKAAIQHLRSLVAGDSKLPDAIIITINKPRLEGIEVLKAIKHTPMLFSIPVIMHSSTPESKYRCLSLDADAFTCKLQSAVEIMAFVSNVLLMVKVRSVLRNNNEVNSARG